MIGKEECYLTLSNTLAPLWKRDAFLSEHDPAAWQQARHIDDWLHQYRDDHRVSVEQYRRNCERLLALYVGEVEEKRLVEVAR